MGANKQRPPSRHSEPRVSLYVFSSRLLLACPRSSSLPPRRLFCRRCRFSALDFVFQSISSMTPLAAHTAYTPPRREQPDDQCQSRYHCLDHCRCSPEHPLEGALAPAIGRRIRTPRGLRAQAHGSMVRRGPRYRPPRSLLVLIHDNVRVRLEVGENLPPADGQRISSRSTRSASPSPKWTILGACDR